MKLTDKARYDFKKWCEQDEAWIQTYDNIYLNTLIIEFMDGVEYNGTTLWEYCFRYQYLGQSSKRMYEIIDQTIIMANKIYNDSI